LTSIKHVKHVQAAIRRASDSYGVELDTHNSSQLHVQIPAPTRESRAQAEAEATKVGEAANVAIKNARAATQKWLRAIELKKTHRPDDLRKAHKEMEKVVDKGKASIKDIVSAAQKAMAR
jgi:ribosome recycling factor